MCAHYGVDGFEGVASRRASGSSVRFVSIGAATATVDESRDDALMLAWARDSMATHESQAAGRAT